MNAPRIVVLGSRTGCDDEAGLLVVDRLPPGLEIMVAGRPGPGLVDLLDRPTVLVDTVRAQRPLGEIVRIALADLPHAAIAGRPLSCHGFGPAEALQLLAALDRRPPPGVFVGIVGGRFDPGAGLSRPVARALPDFGRAVRDAFATLTG